MSRRIRPAAVLLLGLAAAALGTAVSARSAGTTHAVAIDGTRFRPPTIVIRLGDSVVWENKDPFPHTATSSQPAFDSGAIAAGASWTFTPRSKGDFPYVCRLHPTMKGVVRVE